MVRRILVIVLSAGMVFADPALKITLRNVNSAEREVFKCFLNQGNSCGTAVGQLLNNCIILLRVLNITSSGARMLDGCRCFEEAAFDSLGGAESMELRLNFCIFKHLIRRKGVNLPEEIKPEVIR